MEKIPWWKSNTLRALLIAALAQVIAFAGLADEVGSEKVAQLVDAALDLVSLAATLYAAYARARLPTPPVSDAAIAKAATVSQKE